MYLFGDKGGIGDGMMLIPLKHLCFFTGSQTLRRMCENINFCFCYQISSCSFYFKC